MQGQGWPAKSAIDRHNGEMTKGRLAASFLVINTSVALLINAHGTAERMKLYPVMILIRSWTSLLKLPIKIVL